MEAHPQLFASRKALDYRGVLAQAALAASPLDAYLVARAALVLGDYATAERLVSRPGAFDGAPDLGLFLDAQLALYVKRDFARARKILRTLKGRFAAASFLDAELSFVTGYLLNLVDEYAAGAPYHRRAADAFLALDIPGSAAHALFNLCVSYDHLSESELFDAAYARLQSLQTPENGECVELPCRRMRANLAIDREEYEEALEALLPLWGLCRKEGRLRDLGSIAGTTAYLLLKLWRHAEWEDLLERHELDVSDLLPMHQALLGEYDELARSPLIERPQLLRSLTRWKRAGFDSLATLSLLSLACDGLLRAREYATLTWLAARAKTLTLQKQQALSVIDFRYYEAVALARMGQRREALRLCTVYREDALHDKAPRRVAKADAIEREIREAGDTASADTGRAAEARAGALVLHTSQYRATLDGRRIDLARKPVLHRFLLLLVRAGRLVPVPELFHDVYGEPFHPLRHERRFHSLVDRARRVLGSSSLILRVEGRVGLSPLVEAALEESKVPDLPILKRRGQLIGLLSEAGRPLTISQIERHFHYCRRTLQLDLGYLSRSGAIQVAGATRKRRYSALPGASRP